MTTKHLKTDLPYEYQMTYGKMQQYLEAAERAGTHMTGYITFSQDNFEKPYSEECRTYAISSDNNAFRPEAVSPTMYATALDGSDPNVDLSNYLGRDGSKGRGWEIERCYMMSDDVAQARDIILQEREHTAAEQDMTMQM